MATLADLVCRDDDGAPVVIEVKLGFDNAFVSSGRAMTAPFEQWEDSPVNQWRLQVGFTAHMYARTYRLPRPPRALIFWVQRNAAVSDGYRLNVMEVLPFSAREIQAIESLLGPETDVPAEKNRKRKK
jgi:hypothetical protein